MQRALPWRAHNWKSLLVMNTMQIYLILCAVSEYHEAEHDALLIIVVGRTNISNRIKSMCFNDFICVKIVWTLFLVWYIKSVIFNRHFEEYLKYFNGCYWTQYYIPFYIWNENIYVVHVQLKYNWGVNMKKHLSQTNYIKLHSNFLLFHDNNIGLLILILDFFYGFYVNATNIKVFK